MPRDWAVTVSQWKHVSAAIPDVEEEHPIDASIRTVHEMLARIQADRDNDPYVSLYA